MVLGYEPLILDVRVGNLNSLQLLVLVVAALAVRAEKTGSADRRFFVRVIAPGLLVVAMFLKPNIAPAAIAIALLAVSVRLSALVGLLGAALVCAVLPILYFGDLSIWGDWWRNTFGTLGRLGYESASGNFSTPLLVANTFGVGLGAAVAVVAAAGVLFGALTIKFSAPRAGAGTVLNLRRDPLYWGALGITVSLALAPLTWSHYYVLAVFPVVYLLCAPTTSPPTRAAGMVALFIAAGLLRRIYDVSGWPDPQILVVSARLAWLPLLWGLMIEWGQARELR